MTELYKLQKFINQNIRTNGRFPSIQDICSSLNYSEEQARKFMESMAEDGVIERIGSWYRFPEAEKPSEWGKFDKLGETTNPHLTLYNQGGTINIDDDPLILGDPDPIPQNELTTQKRRPGRPVGTTKKNIEERKNVPDEVSEPAKRKIPYPKEYNFDALKWVKIGMGLIGGGATIISIYYSTIWLMEFLPLIFALILSSIMVGFAVLSFEVAIIFAKHKGFKKYAIIACFLFLWGIVSVFSIMSTVGGQYNKNIQNLQKYESSAPGKVEWQNLQSKKGDVEQTIKDLREQLNNFKSLQSSMSGLEVRKANSRTWNDTNWQMKVAGKELTKALSEKENVRLEEKELLKKYPNIISGDGKLKTIPDFYSWVSKVLNKDRDKIQFFLSLIPAVFCDIICSIGIAIFLFLKEE